MNILKNVLETNPAVFTGFILSLFAVLALFGVDVATEANALTLGTFVTSLLPLLSSVAIRSQVYSPESYHDLEDTQDYLEEI